MQIVRDWRRMAKTRGLPTYIGMQTMESKTGCIRRRANGQARGRYEDGRTGGGMHATEGTTGGRGTMAA